MRNLEAEMKRHGVSSENIGLLLGCSGRTIRNKLNGTTQFTYPETEKIRDAYFGGMRLEYLFSCAPDELDKPGA